MSEAVNIGLYYILLEKDPAMIMRFDHGDGGTTLCLIFSRVSGRSFLNQCLKNGVLPKIDFDGFEKVWEAFNFPDFHYEEETIIDGHAAELLCVYLQAFLDLCEEGYNFREVYSLFKEESTANFVVPFPYKSCQNEIGPKDVSAMMVGYDTGTVKYYFDKRDALSLVGLHDDVGYRKRTRKQVLHSALPYQSIEPVRTYTGLTGNLIAYLFWIDREFG